MFNLIVKDPDGTPPERTVWIEAATAPEGTLRVLELVALHFCANFPRLSNLDRMCQAIELLALVQVLLAPW